MAQVDLDYLKRAKKRRDVSGKAIAIVLGIFGLISLLPLIYCFSTAFKPLDELFLYPPRFFAMKPTLKNFSDLMAVTANTTVPFSRYLFNTVIITVGYLFAMILVSTMACYPLSKHNFPGKNIMFKTITTAMMFVAAATAVPSYLIINALHLPNTYFVYIIPGLANTTGVFLLKQFLDQVPNEIFEAGKIDGATEWQLYTKIAIPLMRNAQATIIILSFGGIWGESGTAATYIYDEQLRTLGWFMGTIGGGLERAGASAAASLIMILPTIIMFVVQQSKVMDTMAHSGIK